MTIGGALVKKLIPPRRTLSHIWHNDSIIIALRFRRTLFFPDGPEAELKCSSPSSHVRLRCLIRRAKIPQVPHQAWIGITILRLLQLRRLRHSASYLRLGFQCRPSPRSFASTFPFLSAPCAIRNKAQYSHFITLLVSQRTQSPVTMADYQYGGSEEENAELQKLETELVRFARAN